MLRSRDRLRASIDAVCTGPRESALLLIGDVGCGKSTLLREAHERAPESSVLVRANPGEATWRLSGISALLSALGDPRAAEFAGRFAVRDGTPLASAAGDILILLRGLALPRTTFLIDDIDDMDPESRHLVGYMWNHLGGSSISIVATASAPAADGPLAGVPSTRVAPIDDDDAADLATSSVDPGTLRLLTWSADGNVSALVSHLRSLTREQRDGHDPLRFPLPPGGPADALLARVDRWLGPAPSAFLDRLSMCALHARTSVVRWTDTAEDTLNELVDRGIAVDNRGFVHVRQNLLRSAVAARLSPAEQRGLHAELLAHADALIAPWHAMLANPSSDVRTDLLQSAIGLARIGRPEAATEFSDLAVRLGRSGIGRDLATLADALLLVGELELAARVAAQASLESAEVPAVRRVLARIDFAAGRPASGFEPGELARSARVDPPRPIPDDPPVLAAAARGAILAEDYAEARRAIAALSSALERPSRLWASWVMALGLECATRSGHIGEAFELARQWDPSPRFGAGPDSFIPLTVWRDLAHDRRSEARAALDAWLSHAPARVGPLASVSGLVLSAELALMDGEAEEAVSALQMADMLAADLDDPQFSRHHAGLIEALVLAGRRTTALEVLDRFETGAAHHPGRWTTLALARARVTLSTDADAMSVAHDACALATPSDSPFARGKLLRACAARYAALGAHELAQQAAADARVAFMSAGAPHWAEMPVATPPEPALSTPVVPSSPALPSLTRDEKDVVDLVARGLKNKEIAAQLFVSVRTVELRLTNVYRKLGARSRAHLLSIMR